jgi:hypothetical protein
MKVTTDTLRTTSEQFNNYTTQCGLGFKWSTALDIWSQILGGRNYSALSAQIKAEGGSKTIITDCNKIVELFRFHSRDISKTQAIHIFSESIGSTLSQVSPALEKLVNQVKNDSDLTVTGGANYVGTMHRYKPGYATFNDVSITSFLQSQLIEEVARYLSGRSDKEHYEIYFEQAGECEKTAAQQFSYLLEFEPLFLSSLAVHISENIKLYSDFFKAEDDLTDCIDMYLDKRDESEIRFSFLSVNEEVATDFINIVTAKVHREYSHSIESGDWKMEIDDIVLILKNTASLFLKGYLKKWENQPEIKFS